MRKYIADRNFYKKAMLIVLPVVMQQIVQASVVFIDNFMVAGLGEEAVAGVAIANQFYMLFFPIISAICAGSAIFIAQYYGGKRFDKLRSAFSISLTFPALISLIYILVGVVYADNIIAFFNPNSELSLVYAKQYMIVIVFTYLPFAISNSFVFLFRPIGKARIPFIVSSFALILNAVLNYGLIYGRLLMPEMGVQGAAVGTLIARIVEVVLYVIVFRRVSLPFMQKIGDFFQFSLTSLKEVFSKIGLLLLNEALFSTSLILIFKAYTTRGVIAISALNVAQIVFRYILIFTNGTGTASAILVGNKLGSGNYEEAEKNANYLLGYVLMIGSVVTVVLIGLAFIVPNIYTAFSIETKELLKQMIIILALTVPVMMFTRVPYFVLRAGGRVKEILILDGIFTWLFKIPLAYGLAYFTNVSIIWMLIAVESTRVINGFLSMYLFKQKKWLKKIE